jgi:hypothetical protein
MTEKKREGRPPLDPSDPSVTLTFRLPGKEYEATRLAAKDARLDLGDYLRLALRRINRRPPAP